MSTTSTSSGALIAGSTGSAPVHNRHRPQSARRRPDVSRRRGHPARRRATDRFVLQLRLAVADRASAAPAWSAQFSSRPHRCRRIARGRVVSVVRAYRVGDPAPARLVADMSTTRTPSSHRGRHPQGGHSVPYGTLPANSGFRGRSSRSCASLRSRAAATAAVPAQRSPATHADAAPRPIRQRGRQ